MKYKIATASFILTSLIILPITQSIAEETYISMPGVTLHTDDTHTSIRMDDIMALETDHHDRPKAETVIVQEPRPVIVRESPPVYVQESSPVYTQPNYHPPSPSTARRSVASYSNAELDGMDFRGKNLQNANFANAKLSNSDFAGADLAGAIFSNAELTNINFSGARLVGAKFSNATFKHSSLNNADLSYANLTNSDFLETFAVGTNFDNAILTNVDMSGLIRRVAVAPQPAPVQRPVFVEANTITQALKVDPRKPHEQRKIDLNINFDFNSDALTSEGQKQTHEIAMALADPSFQSSRIMIEGHTDNVGSDQYNLDLSYRRAMRIMRTLTQRYGIPTQQLTAEGYGETRPVASNDTELGRATNRRVTIVNMGDK